MLTKIFFMCIEPYLLIYGIPNNVIQLAWKEYSHCYLRKNSARINHIRQLKAVDCYILFARIDPVSDAMMQWAFTFSKARGILLKRAVWAYVRMLTAPSNIFPQPIFVHPLIMKL